MNFFEYPARPYGYEPLEGHTINFIMLPPNAKIFLITVLVVSMILFLFFFYRVKKNSIKNAIFYGFVSTSVLTSLLFSMRSDCIWLKFLNNMSEKYSRYTSDEKLMMAEVPNHGIYPIFMTIKPYIKGDYKLIAPNLSHTFIQFLIAKANFILPPLKSSDNAPYLIVIDKYAVFDPNTGVLSIGSMEIHGLEPVFFYSKDISVLRVKQ